MAPRTAASETSHWLQRLIRTTPLHHLCHRVSDTPRRPARVIRVLARAGTADARGALGRKADGEVGFEAAPDAKAVLARLAKTP